MFYDRAASNHARERWEGASSMRLKLICCVLAGLLVVAAAGCGSKKKSTKTATTTAATTSESTTSASGGLNLSNKDCANLAAASIDRQQGV